MNSKIEDENTAKQPALQVDNLVLSDILDVQAIQILMNTFFALTKSGNAILDMQGNVLVATGWQDICTKYHRQHPETAGNCKESDTILASGVQEGAYKLYRCKNGLWDIATPIVVEGKHVGNLYLGQFLFEDETPDYEAFCSAARRYGFDEVEYIAALDRAPRMSRETINNAMEFCIQFAKMVSAMGFNNIKLEQKVAAQTHELKTMNEELKSQVEEIGALNQRLTELNEKLEQRVSERTAELTAAHEELSAQYTEYRATQESLKESETSYFDLIKNLTDGISLCDKTGLIIYANQTFADMVQLDEPSKLEGIPYLNFVHPEDRSESINRMASILPGNRVPWCEHRLAGLNGRTIFVMSTGVSMTHNGNPCIMGVFHDITKQKLSEEKILRSAHIQEVLREIAETTALSISLNDLYKTVHCLVGQIFPAENFNISLLHEASGQIVTPYCVDETGVIPQQRPIGRCMPEYVIRQQRAMHVTSAEYDRLREAGEVDSRFVEFKEWLGAPLNDSQGNPFGVITLLTLSDERSFNPEDIKFLSIIAAQLSIAIERKRAEEAVRESEERFSSAFNHAAIGMALVSPEGRWLKVNQSLCRLLGYSEEELLGKKVEDVTQSDDKDRSLENRRQLLADECCSYQLEKRYCHKTGKIIWALISVSQVRSGIGEPLYLVAQIEDISDRKRMELELRQYAEKLEETVERRTQELFAANQELTAVNEELTAMNEEVGVINESLQDANQTLAVAVEIRQQKEQEVLRREKQHWATTSLLTSPAEDVQGLMESILHDAVNLVGAPGGDIALLDESGKNFVFQHTIGINQERHGMKQPVEQGMLGQIYKSGDILYVEDYRQYPHRLNEPRFDRLTTGIMATLKLGGAVKGVLTANWQDEIHPGTAEDVELFRQFGVLASIALERANANRRITYQNQILQQLAETTASLVKELDMDKVLQNILEQATSFTGIPHGFIQMFESDGQHAVYKCVSGRFEKFAGKHIRFDKKGIFAEILRTGKTVVVRDYANWPQRLEGKLFEEANASLQAPLNIDGKTIGSIGLATFGEPLTMDPAKLAVFEQFATIATIAVKNALAHQQTSHLAFHDTLTGLPNRAHLNRRLEEEMKRAQGGGSCGAVMFIDLDDLKTVNDHFGHSSGDSVIIEAGKDIVGAAGETAFVARVGGDEFIVVLSGEEDMKRIAQIADRLIGAIRREYIIRGQSVHMSTSLGVTLYPDDGVVAEEILKKADIAMYAAKAAGKNCWRFYEPEMIKDTYDRMVLTNGLRHAMESGELYLHYQPLITIENNEVAGFEALLRWNSREHGMVSPARFIALAEHSGLILPIGEWVIGEACRFARKLADMGRKNVHVAVNVSPRQLKEEDFVEIVSRCINDACIEPEQLEFEITENVLIESLEDSSRKLIELSALGVGLSLDDFGTGYSSLTYLRNLPVGTLKIDKSFIDRIQEDNVQEGFVRSIVEMAHVLGLRVIAEGVETEAQCLKMNQFGCDCAQGYFFSKPISQDEAIRYLTSS